MDKYEAPAFNKQKIVITVLEEEESNNENQTNLRW